jgi:hypothetical protein
MADNHSVMGSELAAEPMLPGLRPSGVGRVAWALARVVGQPGVRYGVLLVAVAAGLVGSAALLGHAFNAPSLSRYQRSLACGIAGARPPDCRAFVAGTVERDSQLPLGVHVVTLSIDGRTAIYYGRADVYHSQILLAGSEALLIGWHGRAARVVGRGLVVEPFEGPPGLALLLIILAIACELVCGVALMLQGISWRLRLRVTPLAPARTASRGPTQLVFLGALVVAVMAGRSGHAGIAVPLHAACGLVAAGLLGSAGAGSARSLAAIGQRGLDGLSDERALRLGADVALAVVLVALCLSLTADLVVGDVLSLPR